ncbi:MAG: YdcF family protein [Ilumatobacteraceae bacterium]
MRDLVEPLWLPILVLVGVWVVLWRTKRLPRWGAFTGAAALFALWLVSMPFGAFVLERPLVSESPPEDGWTPDYIYVLSAGFELGDRPQDDSSGLETTRRVNRAAAIWRDFPSATLVMAGAQPGLDGVRASTQQGYLMQAQAERLGVPSEAIIIDSVSLNTNGHAKVANDADFLQSTTPLLIVTSDFHLRRAQREFSRYFDNLRMVGSDPDITDTTWGDIGITSFFPRVHALRDSTVYLREYVALMLSDLRN